MADEFGEDMAVLGKPGTIDKQAELIVTGKLDFAADHMLGKKLHGRMLLSPHPHARITSIDTSNAEALDGVKAVITYKDGYPFTAFLKEELTWWGQEVACVIATEVEIAEEALGLIEVEYEVLPFVIDPDEAMKDETLTGVWADSNVKQSSTQEIGDIEAGFDEADVIVEDTVGWTNHFQQSNIETRTAVAWWIGDHCYLRCPSYNLFGTLSSMATFLDHPRHKIHIVSHGMGICCGDKRSPLQAHIIAAEMSRRLGQPVQMQHTRREFFLNTEHQHKAKGTVKFGLKDDGTITAIDATFYGDSGGYGSTWASSCSWPLRHTFKCDNVRCQIFDVATNTAWPGIYRSVQNPPGEFIMEVVLDKAAEELGMDPFDLRYMNLVTPDMVEPDSGNPYASNGVIKCFDAVKETIDWDSKWHTPGTRTLDDGRLHGIGIAGCVESHSSLTSTPIGAIINMTRDGKAMLDMSISRVGCGTNSAVCAIVAETLGLNYEDVMVGDWANTDVSSEGTSQGGSKGLISFGSCFQVAAEDCRRQLYERAAPLLEVSVDELDIGGGAVFEKGNTSNSVTIVDLMNISRSSPIIGAGYSWAKELRKPLYGFPVGHPCETRCQCASATEVAVDPDTGEVEILNIANSVDFGRVARLSGAQKQLYAGIESIMAQALYWEQITDQVRGGCVNPNFLDHKYPTPLDFPQDKYNIIPVESIDACGPHGCKGVGEPVITSYASVIGAIHNATGKWFKEVPVTPARILKALGKA